MEQKPPTPGHTPELPRVPSLTPGETIPAFLNPETEGGSQPERKENQAEAAPSAEGSTAPPVILPMPAPATQAPSDDSVSSSQSDASTPSVANDDELIEKEWVDKAKKVIAETKDDPYRREKEVNQLQADYIFKRYGRKIGSTEQ